MEMHQIRYFLAVCETLNFTRAAEQCHVTQPALTRAIQKLEDELGGLLFRRERHLTHLTDLGRLIQPRLEQIWKGTEGAKTTARSFLKLENAPLNLGVMCTIGPLRGISFVTDFWRSNQGIEITLREGVPQRLGELLREGELDLGVMAQWEPFDERFNVDPSIGNASSSPSRQDIGSRRRTASPWPTLTARVISFESIASSRIIYARCARSRASSSSTSIAASARTGSRPW